MSPKELCYLSASDALALFEARKLSPVEYLEAQIERAEAVEPKINAFAFTYYDEARQAARAAEERYTKTGAAVRALEGLPLAVKDEMDIEGKVTTDGSLYLEDNVGAETHYSVVRLLRAGAIVHARTTTPEFSCAGVCHSRLHGVTGTPWNPAYTAGGSSGGSGAALAAGSTPLATGSDIGGSIRVPAAACGVVGYKPPFGRNPDNTHFAFDMYATMGPMTRSIADCILMQNVMAGAHPLDIASLRPRYRIPQQQRGIEGWKIAYSLDLGYFEVAEDVRRNTLHTLDTLQDLGAEIEEVAFGWDGACDRAAQNYLDHLFGGHIKAYVETDPKLASEWAKYCAQAHDKVGAAQFMDAYQVATRLAHRVGAIFERFHVLICPTLGSHEIPADHEPDVPIVINGQPVDVLYGWCLCHPFNMLGRCPVLSVPSGFGDAGLPTGIQIVARHLDDRRVFQVGVALEQAQPWLDRPERRPENSDPMYEKLDNHLKAMVDTLVEHGRTALWPERRAALASFRRGIETSARDDRNAAAQVLRLEDQEDSTADAMFRLILTAYLERLGESEITNPDQAALYSYSLDHSHTRLADAWYDRHPEYREPPA